MTIFNNKLWGKVQAPLVPHARVSLRASLHAGASAAQRGGGPT